MSLLQLSSHPPPANKSTKTKRNSYENSTRYATSNNEASPGSVPGNPAAAVDLAQFLRLFLGVVWIFHRELLGTFRNPTINNEK